ncbi:MAG: hypothetical protein E2598_04415 [Sphingobium sp.]|nr:hypothetical protein [Sphingobium sp.]
MPSSPSPAEIPSDNGPGSHAPATNKNAWMRGTASKAFFIMMLALLPLALASMASSIWSLRSSAQERYDFLAAAARQDAGRLSTDIQTIRTALRMTSGVLVTDNSSGDICARLQNLFAAMTLPEGINVAIFDRDGKVRCQSTYDAGMMIDAWKKHRPVMDQEMGDIMLSPELNGLLIRSASRDGSFLALALYRHKALQQLTHDYHEQPSQNRHGQSLALLHGGAFLPITPLINSKDNAPVTTIDAPVADTQLILRLQSTNIVTLNSQWIWLLMPLFLWVAAVFLGWLVVRWLLIKPLMALNHEVAAYVPGQILHPPHLSRLASGEIIELGNHFHMMSHSVAAHEEQMQSALDRQTRLTREVHHRVKNNLQIISSLISLHWRAASDPQAADAYLSIQRRVDALAVVQRNHYAGLDEELGLRARPMMNEIASALKMSARVQSGQAIDIAVDCDDITLHQDVAAPIAFMTAELADQVIEHAPEGLFTLSLLRLENDQSRARFALSAPVFRRAEETENASPTELYERVLTGLARQLRTPLGYNAEAGEYHLLVPITG